jgi:hypothetical protein
MREPIFLTFLAYLFDLAGVQSRNNARSALALSTRPNHFREDLIKTYFISTSMSVNLFVKLEPPGIQFNDTYQTRALTQSKNP